MINRLMTEVHKLDPDVLVGHNISGFDLDVLLHRAQVLISLFFLYFLSIQTIRLSLSTVLFSLYSF
jgi:DNA polymerase elongation subunit (family B)